MSLICSNSAWSVVTMPSPSKLESRSISAAKTRMLVNNVMLSTTTIKRVERGVVKRRTGMRRASETFCFIFLLLEERPKRACKVRVQTDEGCHFSEVKDSSQSSIVCDG